MKNNVYFCTFADSRLTPTLRRIEKEAISFGIFKELFLYNEFTLGKKFRTQFKDLLRYRVRGYGYWVWKAHIIRESLLKINDGDFLLYLDSGCSLNKQGMPRFNTYLNQVSRSKSGIMAVSTENLPEKKWTKGDVFDYFGVRDQKEITDTSQIQASMILIQKSKSSMDLIDSLNSAISKSPSLIDDSVSNSCNYEGFVEHRHDQSLFSVLAKIHNVECLPLSEVYVNDKDDLTSLDDKPLWCMRMKNRKINGLFFLVSNVLKHFLLLVIRKG
jgi:hypothetical protein